MKTSEPQQVECPAECDGGRILLGVHIVDRWMAMDGGDPQLEGMEIPEWGPCPQCGGDGWLSAPSRASEARALTSPQEAGE